MKDGFPEFVMDTASLMLFAAALFVAAMLPGPGIVALVARVLAHGTTGAVAFGLGFLIGDLVWLACAVTGLAAVAALFSEVFLIVKYVGAAYLTYLAAKMWRAGTQLSPTSGHGDGQSALRLMTAGLTLTLGNPKVMVFYLALLPNLIAIDRITATDFVLLALTTASVLGTVLAGYILLADRARRLFRSARAVRRLNRGASVAITGAAAAIVVR